MPLLQRAIHCLLVLSLVILVPASPVAAQGTAGVFPDPLDWSSFQTILDPLELSPEQIAQMRHGQHASKELCSWQVRPTLGVHSFCRMKIKAVAVWFSAI